MSAARKPSPDKSNRGLSRRDVLFGAVTALAGSLIGVVGAVSIALIGIHHENSNRLYDAKKEAYADYLTILDDTTETLTQLRVLSGRILNTKDTSTGDYKKLLKKYFAQQDEVVRDSIAVDRAAGAVNIYGSEEVYTVTNNMSGVLGVLANGIPTDPRDAKQVEDFSGALSEYYKFGLSYLTAIRSDLDVPGPGPDRDNLDVPLL